MPRVIEVIESEVMKGEGKDGDPYRRVTQYHTLKGRLLAEYDNWSVTLEPPVLKHRECPNGCPPNEECGYCC